MRTEQTHRLILNAPLVHGQRFQGKGQRIDFAAFVTESNILMNGTLSKDARGGGGGGEEEEEVSDWVYFALKVRLFQQQHQKEEE